MTASRSSTLGTDPWAAYEWVVWQIEVDDPEARISEPYHEAGTAFLLAEDSREVMEDLAAQLGCVYDGCRDDGCWGSDDTPYYSWWIQVPQDQHAQRGLQGWPVAVEKCQQQLNRMFADGHHWRAFVHARRTRALDEAKTLCHRAEHGLVGIQARPAP